MNAVNFREFGLALALGVALSTAPVQGIGTPGPASNSTTTPGSAPADASHRTASEVSKEFGQEAKALQSVLSWPDEVLDPARRTQNAAKIVPVLKKMIGLLDEMRQLGDVKARASAAEMRPQLQKFLAIFGDGEALRKIEQEAGSSDKDQALAARGSLLQIRCIESAPDPAAQKQVVAEAVQFAKDNPRSETVTDALVSISQMGPASRDLADKLQDAAAAMNTELAQKVQQQVENRKQLRALENKPLVVAGVLNNGSAFSTSDWKGKVILVDFWATWCPPCRAALPRVKKVYADFHDKGLEIVGVSNDRDIHDLDRFLQDNKDMPWPQLFDASMPGWHPLATEYGVMSIPTMFLIDRDGIVRSVSASEDFQKQVPKLLAESARPR